MSLLSRVARVLSFNVLQTIVSKLTGAIQLAILLRLLPLSDIGAIGLVGGYAGLLAVLHFSPETIFLREYSRFSKQLNENLSSFLFFGIARGLLIALLGIPIAWWIIYSLGRVDVGIYLLLFLLVTGISMLTGPFREAFYAQYRQARITMVDLTINIFSLVLITGLFFYPDILMYGTIQLFSALAGLIWWYWNARKHLGFSWVLPLDWIYRARTALSSFSIWNHLLANSLRVVYQADVIILSFFVGLSDLGAYSVALTLANLFFIVPQYIQKITTLSLSGEQPVERIRKAFGLAVKYNGLFSFFQFFGWLVVSPIALFLLGVKDPLLVSTYALLLIAGTSLFNLARPWMALLIARYDAKKLFMELFLYPGFIALALYAYSASVGGVIAVAWANILVYGVLFFMLVGFTYRRLHLFPTIFPLCRAEDKNIVQKMKSYFSR